MGRVYFTNEDNMKVLQREILTLTNLFNMNFFKEFMDVLLYR